MLALCVLGGVLLCTGAVVVDHERASTPSHLAPMGGPITATAPSTWSSEWVTVGPWRVACSARHVFEGFGLVIATGVRDSLGNEHAVALCAGDWHALAAAEHCVYFDEAALP